MSESRAVIRQSSTSDPGVVYTEHSGLAARTPVASLWSYDTRGRGRARRSVALNPDGSREYWLDRSDPLLNTIQAHMINEFRAFVGSPPTTFFRPHGGDIDPATIRLRGRPSEWLRRPEASTADTPAPPSSS